MPMSRRCPLVRSVILLGVMSAACANPVFDPKYGRLPLYFEANLGQAPPDARYFARAADYRLLITDAGALLELNDQQHSTIRMKMSGANPGARFVPLEKLPGISNYYIGNDRSRWRTNVPQYSRLERRDVYPGIDIVFYGNDGQLEYDCIVSPGADPSQIRLVYEGVERLHLDSNGDLLLSAGGRELRQKKPVVYQEDRSGQRLEISGGYRLNASNNEVRFTLGGYDHTRALVVDPALAYVAYPRNNAGVNGIAVDGDGNAYITGFTGATTFPNGSSDAFIAKLNPSGTALVYFTTIGGSSIDYSSAIAIDQNRNAYMAGVTQSSDFPVKSAAQPVKPGGQDGFVTKLDANGAMVFSTYVGGSGQDSLNAIAADASSNVYVDGQSASNDFPAIHALQSALPGVSSSVIAKLNPSGSSFLFSTYLGDRAGFSVSSAQGLALGLDGGIWIAGYCGPLFPSPKQNPNACGPLFPTVNPIQQSTGEGITNAFISELDNSGSNLLFSTVLGGNGLNGASAITVDRFGNILVAGSTNSGNFPLVSPLQANLDNANNAFVAKLSPNPPTLLYSTYFSGDGATGIAVDNSGNATIVGRFLVPNPGGFGHFPLVYSLPSLAVDNGYAAQIDSAGTTILYSTFVNDTSRLPPLGYPSAVAVDNAGNAYIAGNGAYVVKLISQPGLRCSPFIPLTPQSFSAAGGAGAIIISYPAAGCGQIPVHSTADPTPWLRYSPSTSGGAGVLRAIGFTVDANNGGARQASLLINGTGITVSQAGSTPPPATLGLIGSWDTPVSLVNASGVVAISGWALSSNPISVQIYRNTVPGEQSPNGLIFIGSSTFVAGARPDIAAQHPEYSSNNNAGWSYALLTNTLPNSDGSAGKGSGTYQLTAIFQDSANQITFPSRSIIVSNKNASKPFGAIDTPAPGAIVSGNSYVNFGWALTPPPFQIPMNGSTINVFLDGKPAGALASYNNFRPDVAAVLPGYQNSNGAVGFAMLDTTVLKTGQHTISWGITDNGNQTASAGNRTFTVLDGTSTAQTSQNRAQPMSQHTQPVRKPRPLFSGQVVLQRGYDLNAPLEPLHPDKTSTYDIVIRQLDRLEMHLLDAASNPVACTSNSQLPVGSALDEETCTFYWQIDPSFLGNYSFVFSSELGDLRGHVTVIPQNP